MLYLPFAFTVDSRIGNRTDALTHNFIYQAGPGRAEPNQFLILRLTLPFDSNGSMLYFWGDTSVLHFLHYIMVGVRCAQNQSESCGSYCRSSIAGAFLTIFSGLIAELRTNFYVNIDSVQFVSRNVFDHISDVERVNRERFFGYASHRVEHLGCHLIRGSMFPNVFTAGTKEGKIEARIFRVPVCIRFYA